MQYQEELFKKELDVLHSALADCEKAEYQDNEMMERYKELIRQYDKLLNVVSKVFKISDAQGKELKKRENEIKNLLDSTNQGFLTFGRDLLINREYSAECARIFDRKISGVNIVELLTRHAEEQYEHFAQVFRSVFQTEDAGERMRQLSRLPSLLHIHGSYISVQYRLVPYDSFADEDVVMMILTDITDKQKVEDQVVYLSYHDNLTSLYNRAYIEQIVPQLQGKENMPLSMIMVDMNGLKLTNDIFGHQAGDRLLINISKVFTACCSKDDIAARWGGDEFLILLPRTDAAKCQEVCQRIKDMCEKAPADPIELSASFGSVTVENPQMNTAAMFSAAENMMYNRKLIESKSTHRKMMDSMTRILRSRSFEDPEHMERIMKSVLQYTSILPKKADSIDSKTLGLLAAFHDIGKVAIPETILGKAEKLTPEEWSLVKGYPEIGFRMAQSIEEPALAQAILAIRERWDGTGYPRGLKGEQIPLVSRVVSIAEAFDVMTHEQPYKRALGEAAALRELEQCGGTQFDPELVQIFIKSRQI